jgi:hypothetical protein
MTPQPIMYAGLRELCGSLWWEATGCGHIGDYVASFVFEIAAYGVLLLALR